MRQIGVQNVKLSEYEMSIAAHLVDPLTMQVRNGSFSLSQSGFEFEENTSYTNNLCVSTDYMA